MAVGGLSLVEAQGCGARIWERKMHRLGRCGPRQKRVVVSRRGNLLRAKDLFGQKGGWKLSRIVKLCGTGQNNPSDQKTPLPAPGFWKWSAPFRGKLFFFVLLACGEISGSTGHGKNTLLEAPRAGKFLAERWWLVWCLWGMAHSARENRKPRQRVAGKNNPVFGFFSLRRKFPSVLGPAPADAHVFHQP